MTATVRQLDGVDDNIIRAIGALSGMQFGAIVALVRIADFASFRTIMGIHNSAPDIAVTLYSAIVGPGTVVYEVSGDNTSGDGTLNSGVWLLIVARKATGANTPRFSVLNLSTDTWAHADGGDALSDATAPGAGGTVEFAYEGATDFAGRVAVEAAWADSLPWSADAAGDTAIEVAGLETAAQNWLDASPSAMWRFNQSNVSTDVTDDTGNGADQTAITGTTVVTDTDLVFDFTLGGVTGSAAGSYTFTGAANGTTTVVGSAAGSFGYSGTAAGTRTVSGQAAASVTFTGTATGTPTTTGSASGSFGYTGTATGTPTVVGSAVASVTYTGAATGAVTVVGSAAGSFAYSGTASGVIEGETTGSAAGSFAYTGTAAGTVTVVGSAAMSVTFTGHADAGPLADPNPVVISHTEHATVSHVEHATVAHAERAAIVHQEV